MKNPAASTPLATTTEDPSLAAALVAFGFPMSRPPQRVQREDLSAVASPDRSQRVILSWAFAPVSKDGSRTALSVQDAWHSPALIPPPDYALPLSDLSAARLAIHNYRCLQKMINGGAPLHVSMAPHFGRLSNYPQRSTREVPVLNPAFPALHDTVATALAVTFGLQMVGSGTRMGRCAWQVAPQDTARTPYSLRDIVHAGNSTDYMLAESTTLAYAAATLYNFRQLLQGRFQQAPSSIVLHKDGRYAVLSSAADKATQRAVCQGLNI